MWLAFGIGVVIGFFLGILIISLLCMASKNSQALDDAMRWERMRREMGVEKK